MIVEIRQKSQITIPSEIMKELSLKIGDKLELSIINGALTLTPVTIYPKEYVEKLEKEVMSLREKIETKESKVYDNLDDMFDSLEIK